MTDHTRLITRTEVYASMMAWSLWGNIQTMESSGWSVRQIVRDLPLGTDQPNWIVVYERESSR